MKRLLISSCGTRTGALLVALLGVVAFHAAAQSPVTYQYLFDAAGQFIGAVDSTGVRIQLTHDNTGNVTAVTRSGIASGLNILSFSPAQGGPGATVSIQGQGFDPVAANDVVKFNGVSATVTSASANALTVTIPPTATTGTIAVTTGGVTATSASTFTVLAIPLITGTSTRYLLAGQTGATIGLTGINFTGAAFSIQPPTSPAAVTIANATVAGNSATLTVSTSGVSANTVIVATTAAGSSSIVATLANSLTVLLPNLDSDNDGLTNAQEIALGTDPLMPDTDGDGMWDGWEVHYGLNPLDPTDAAKPSKAGDGLTNLQEFLGGLDPTAADRTVPSVTSSAPASGATGVAVNSVITLAFNEQILTTAQVTALAVLNPNVTAPVFSVAAAGVPVSGTVVTSPSGLTFTPSRNLNISTTYTISASGYRASAAGVLQTVVFTGAFTTGNQPDTTAPTVIRTSPLTSGASNSYSQPPVVSTNTPVSVEFSKPIDPSSLNSGSFQVTNSRVGVALAGRYLVDSTGRIATFYPATPLPVGALIIVNLLPQRIMDLAGNSLAANYTFYFSTGTATDSTPPVLAGNSPADGDKGISVNAQVIVGFNKPVSEIAASHGIAVTYNGSPVPGSFTFLNGDMQMQFVPASPYLPGATTVTVTSGVTDYAGNALVVGAAFTFTVDMPVDTVPPGVTAFSPPNGAVAGINAISQVGFTERIDPLLLPTFGVVASSASGPIVVAGKVVVSADRLTATFTPAAPLLPNTQYCSNFPFVDLAGNRGGSANCFTSTAVSDATVPVVTGINPANGATNIPLNAVLVARMSKPLNPVSFLNNAATVIALTAGGPSIPGTAALSADGLTIGFTPAAQLSPGLVHTIVVSGVTDYENHLVTPFTSTFTTGTAADTIVPVVTSFAPANGAVNVPVNTSIVISFSKLIDPLTVNATTISVGVPSKSISVAGTYSVDNSGSFGIVSFKPSALLPGGLAVTVNVNGVQDFAGNADNDGAAFTTAAFADTTPPTVTSVTPTNGSTGMGPSTLVSLTFSKPVSPATVNGNNFALFSGNVRLSATLSASQDFQTVTIAAGIPPSSTISVAVTHDVQDLAGNALADYLSTFGSAPTPDVSSPTIVGQRPGAGNSGVPATAPIILFASKTLDPATVQGALIVAQNGQPIAGAVTLSGNNKAIQFAPAAPYAAGSTIQIFLTSAAADTTGKPMVAYQGSFTVAPDLTGVAPVVTAFIPSLVPGQYTAQNPTGVSLNPVIEIQFSKPLDPTTLSGNVSLTYYLPGGQAPLTAPVTVSLAGPQTIRIAPNSLLLPGIQYTVIVANAIKDTTGLSPLYLSNVYFTTGTAADNAQPRVTAISPPDTSAGIGTNAPVEVRFNKPVDRLSVTTGTVSITAGGTPLTLASVNAVGTSSQDFLIVPFGLLPDASQVTVSIAGVQDLSGNILVPASAGFTTRTGFDLVSPNLISSNPFNGATGVPTNAPITFQFDKPIDPYSVSAATIRFADDTGQVVSGTFSVSSNELQATFAPDAPLAVGRAYYISISAGVHDLAGNSLAGANLGFTAGFAPSTTSPHVLLTSPDNALSSVPVNAVLQVLFDEPVQASGLSGVSLTVAGNPVAGIVNSLSNGNTVLTITPPALLKANTAYAINVAGVTDLASHAIGSPVISAFTTSSGARLLPTTYAFDPPNGAQAVGTNVVPSFVASYRINPISVNSSTVTFYSYGLNKQIPVTAIPSADRLSVAFTPLTPLQPTTGYCLNLFGVTDQMGVALNNYPYGNQTCFVTAPASDTVHPIVVSVSPPDKSINAPVNVAPSVLISEPLNPNSVTGASVALTAGGQSVQGTVALAADLETITFTPAASLTAGVSYTLIVSGLTDIAGNTVTPFTSSFQIDPLGIPDTTAPTVVSTSPNYGATGVPNAGPITVTFSEPVNPVFVNAANLVFTLVSNGAQFAGTLTVNGAVVTFTPLSPLPANAVVNGTIANVLDFAGNPSPGYVLIFTAASGQDTTPPAVTSITPASGTLNMGPNTLVSVTFSKSIDPSTINNGTFGLFNGAARLTLNALTSSQDHTSVTMDATKLPPSSVITAAITHGVLDLSGNALPDFTSSFTTAAVDTNIPQVALYRPVQGATGVPANAQVEAIFATPMDSASTLAAVTVSQNGSVVAGTAALTGNGQDYTFTPAVPFPAGALVQVFISTLAMDLGGNHAYPSVASFTVASDLTSVAPVVTGSTPGYYDLPPLNAMVQVQFSKPLDPSTVNSSALTMLLNSPPYGAVAGTVSLVGDRTIQFVPASPFLPSAAYVYNLSLNIRDTTGLNITTASYGQFVTGVAADTSQPRVLYVTPPDTSVAIGGNASVQVQFSKNVNTLTATASTIRLTVNGQPVAPVTISFDYLNNQGVTITPYAAFPDNAKVTVSVSGVQDEAGNLLIPFTSSFTTGAGAVLAGHVIGASPPLSATGVPLNAIITIATDDPVDPATVNANGLRVTDAATATAIPGAYSISANGKVVSFAPSVPFKQLEQVTFVSELRDLNDNVIVSGPSSTYGSFTTSNSAVTTPPSVVLVNPPDGFTNVPTDIVPQILFSEPLNVATVGAISLSAGGAAINTAITLGNGNQTVSLVPPGLLQPSTFYTITIGAVADTSGNTVTSPIVFHFTTGTGASLASPYVSSLFPAGSTNAALSTVVSAVFSAPLNPLTLSAANFQLTDPSAAVVPGALALSADGLTVTFTPAAALLPNATYTVTLVSLTDLAGNTLAATSTVFTTAAQ